MVASLQFGAAGLATRDESAVATDAAIAATAVTAETAMTMAFLIDMPSFDFPASGTPCLTSNRRRSCPEAAADECLPALVGRL